MKIDWWQSGAFLSQVIWNIIKVRETNFLKNENPFCNTSLHIVYKITFHCESRFFIYFVWISKFLFIFIYDFFLSNFKATFIVIKITTQAIISFHLLHIYSSLLHIILSLCRLLIIRVSYDFNKFGNDVSHILPKIIINGMGT